MYILLFLMMSLYAADNTIREDDETMTGDSPSRVIEEALVDMVPDAVHIVSSCLTENPSQATLEGVEIAAQCITSPRSPMWRLFRGIGLGCKSCLGKKKRQ